MQRWFPVRGLGRFRVAEEIDQLMGRPERPVRIEAGEEVAGFRRPLSGLVRCGENGDVSLSNRFFSFSATATRSDPVAALAIRNAASRSEAASVPSIRIFPAAP